MEAELVTLQQKIEQLAELCEVLRTENQDLRVKVAGLESDRRRLADKVDGARDRLEALIERMPAP